MNIQNLKLKDALLIEPKIYSDERGCFLESYNKKEFSKIVGKEITFVQDNYSESQKNVLRGMHFQVNPEAQGKLIKVISGEIYDVLVDIRRSSSTFMQWEGVNLSSNCKKQISDVAKVSYKVTAYYNPKYENAIRYDDPDLAIDWPKTSEYILSEKDKQAKSVKENTLFE